MNTRDINRIPRLILLLERVWLKQPDSRFFQLIDELEKAFVENGGSTISKKVTFVITTDVEQEGTLLDSFNVEDDEFIQFLEGYVVEAASGTESIRMQELLLLFKLLWSSQPDTRFFQLIHNLKHIYAANDSSIIPRKYKYRMSDGFEQPGTALDAYYVEDTNFIDFLKTRL
ncbi:hypothetical protein [Bacillus cereus group sp. TH152-1LC]|uniref:hypothetical protein n=1 Tax=Bacillus cereus group sp. TH152-1LC TaxID=3018060 RepID=UPI0022E3B701|nr:hypothetical protein [Bacillus cereus group sp. TH152-1LC]MDA1675499.1 hypothetical protein [Bacillus cereus group sp. TH152-1LC]